MALFENRNFMPKTNSLLSLQSVNTRSGYLALAGFCFILFLLIGLYFGTASSMVEIWLRSDTFAHGFLIVPITCFMIWTKRQELLSIEIQVNYLGLFLLMIICFGWFVAYLGKVLVIQQIALVAMISAVVFTLFGTRITKTIFFPLAYLIFTVPFGADLVPALMDFTASFTVMGLKLTGIPVFWEGRYIVIPSGNFVVAEACSGLRYLIASIALGCLYSFLSYRSLWRRLAFISISIAVPIVANGIRAYGIVMIAHLSSMKFAVGIDHIIYGWLFFGLVILLMFWIGSWWREPVDNNNGDYGSYLVNKTNNVEIKNILVALGFITIIISSGPLTVAWFQARELGLNPIALQAPGSTETWQLSDVINHKWQPKYIGATEEIRATYNNKKNGKQVDLYIAYYKQQQQGAELINSQNSLYNRDNWRLVSNQEEQVKLEYQELTINKTLLSIENNKRLIWYWYWVSGYTTTSDTETKILEIWERLMGSNQGSAIVAVSAGFEIAQAEADELLVEFLNDVRLSVENLVINP